MSRASTNDPPAGADSVVVSPDAFPEFLCLRQGPGVLDILAVVIVHKLDSADRVPPGNGIHNLHPHVV